MLVLVNTANGSMFNLDKGGQVTFHGDATGQLTKAEAHKLEHRARG